MGKGYTSGCGVPTSSALHNIVHSNYSAPLRLGVVVAAVGDEIKRVANTPDQGNQGG